MRVPFFAATAIAAMFNFANFANSAEIYSPKTVVELFTSQGCHSCPPADKNLAELIKSKDYLGLAFHVDYWNYLGWKDTFSSAEFTKRQRNYSVAMKERQIYTPQAVINGRNHLVGSRGNDIKEMSALFQSSGKGMKVPINVIEKNGKLSVSIDASDTYKDATLYAVYFEPKATVKIKAGELAGKTLSYTNIVRKVEMLGMNGSNGLNMEFSISDIKEKGFEGCALILQSKVRDKYPGPIIGASVITDL